MLGIGTRMRKQKERNHKERMKRFDRINALDAAIFEANKHGFHSIAAGFSAMKEELIDQDLEDLARYRSKR